MISSAGKHQPPPSPSPSPTLYPIHTGKANKYVDDERIAKVEWGKVDKCSSYSLMCRLSSINKSAERQKTRNEWLIKSFRSIAARSGGWIFCVRVWAFHDNKNRIWALKSSFVLCTTSSWFLISSSIPIHSLTRLELLILQMESADMLHKTRMFFAPWSRWRVVIFKDGKKKIWAYHAHQLTAKWTFMFDVQFSPVEHDGNLVFESICAFFPFFLRLNLINVWAVTVNSWQLIRKVKVCDDESGNILTRDSDKACNMSRAKTVNTETSPSLKSSSLSSWKTTESFIFHSQLAR